MKSQPGILSPIALHTRFLEFSIKNSQNLISVLERLSTHEFGDQYVVGLGQPIMTQLNATISGLTSFPEFKSKTTPVPTTQSSLWVCIRGEDRGEIDKQYQDLFSQLKSAFSLTTLVDGFKYDIGRDLTGYEDGTENPEGRSAIAAAILNNVGMGLDGSSFVAIQKWLHDFDTFDQMSGSEQDNAIGRHRLTNEEFDAPESAHVKRTAQEDFDPEAFIVRRSLPWSDDSGSGLMFVAFGASFYAFEAQMNRMIGLEDGICDGLFQFSKPVTGGYYWCPPVTSAGYLDLSAIGLS